MKNIPSSQNHPNLVDRVLGTSVLLGAGVPFVSTCFALQAVNAGIQCAKMMGYELCNVPYVIDGPKPTESFLEIVSQFPTVRRYRG